MFKSRRQSKQVKNYKNKFEDRTVVISEELYYGNDTRLINVTAHQGISNFITQPPPS
jgi:hypothetical protein